MISIGPKNWWCIEAGYIAKYNSFGFIVYGPKNEQRMANGYIRSQWSWLPVELHGPNNRWIRKGCLKVVPSQPSHRPLNGWLW